MIDTTATVTRRTRVLVADDTESVRALFRKLLLAEGHDVIAVQDGAEALDAIEKQHPDIVLLDVQMPRLDGLEVPRPEFIPQRLTPWCWSRANRTSDRIKASRRADEFLTKPVHPHELRARVASLSRMKQLIDALDCAEAAFMTLALTIEARDPNTNGHCERLAHHAVLLGRTLGLGADDLNALHRGGYLHDVGKVGIPDAVLLKPGKLTVEEMELMRRHPEIGDTLCAPLQSLRHVRPIILSHHERLDGSGYPHRLKGDQVPVLAQIVGIVDVYDALTSRRPYRGPLSPEEAGKHLRDEMAQGKFARPYVEAFLDVIGAKAEMTAIH